MGGPAASRVLSESSVRARRAAASAPASPRRRRRPRSGRRGPRRSRARSPGPARRPPSCGRVAARRNGSKTRWRSSAGMPVPVSATSISTPSSTALGAHRDAAVGRRVADRVLDQVEEHALQPLGVAARAGARVEHEPRPTDGRRRRPCGRIASTASLDELVERDLLHRPARARRASRRLSSKRSSMSAPSARTWAPCGRAYSRRVAPSTTPSSIASASSRSDVIGVRRSCETAATSARAGALLAVEPGDHGVDVARRGRPARRARRPDADVAAPGATAASVARTASRSPRARAREQVARPTARGGAAHATSAVRNASWPETNISATNSGDDDRRLRDDEQRERAELPAQPAEAARARDERVPRSDGEQRRAARAARTSPGRVAAVGQRRRGRRRGGGDEREQRRCGSWRPRTGSRRPRPSR